MRWLLLALLVSTVALLAASAGVVHHIWQARKQRTEKAFIAEKQEDVKTEEAP